MRVLKWGNSLGIRIPMMIAKTIGLSEGTFVEILIENDNIVIRRKGSSLDELLAQVKPENIHSEIDTGKPVGREQW